MKFCPNCGRAMARDTASGAIVYRCFCGEEVAGGPQDARVAGGLFGARETVEVYRILIQKAPFDRTDQLVRRPCPECGLDYMTQIRVGSAEVVVYKCKCGYEEGGTGGRRAPL